MIRVSFMKNVLLCLAYAKCNVRVEVKIDSLGVSANGLTMAGGERL